MTKTRVAFYRAYDRTMVQDIKHSVERRDWKAVEEQFYAYGKFLERHNEAIGVL